jgi:hypothetical protein
LRFFRHKFSKTNVTKIPKFHSNSMLLEKEKEKEKKKAPWFSY